MRLLVFCFEPFGGETVNAGAEAVRLLPRRIGGAELLLRTLPVSFARAGAEAVALMRSLRPDCALAVGQATGRGGVTPERTAVNLADARIPDNDGAAPHGARLVPDGPEAYQSNLPVAGMAEAILRAGLPASVSDSAGTFVCNAVLYALLHAIHTEFPGMGGGFIHVPCLPEQAKPGVPSMTAEASAAALTAALAAAADALCVPEN